MKQHLEKVLFLAILFSFILQTGKHFWPRFSVISGIRVDYLSPTLHLSDILILTLFGVTIVRFITHKKRFNVLSRVKLANPYFILVAIIFLSSFFAESPFAAWFGVFKLFEFVFLGWFIVHNFSKKEIIPLVKTLLVAAFFTSIIVFFQFYKQASIGGVLYFFGERTFHASTIGIAKIQFNSSTLLRPYATFPHPNVLAFFLFMSIVFSLFCLQQKKRVEKVLYVISIVVIHGALLLTLSRMVLICLGIFWGYFLMTTVLTRKKKVVIWGALALTLCSIYILSFPLRFFSISLIARDWGFRQELLTIAFSIFKDNSLFGVGLNNFFYHEIAYQRVISPTLLQPVHNIYVLVLIQLGVFGFIFFIWFLKKTFVKLISNLHQAKDSRQKEFYTAVFVLFLSVLFIGLFDHFLLTLQQGQLIFMLILGLAWSRLK